MSGKHDYSPWRHGGWYVTSTRWPNGGCGCVSRNYADKQWRIVCDERRREIGGEGDFTFPSRDAAADAEIELIKLTQAKTELTPAGEQYVVPGCEHDRTRAKVKQLGLWD